jgi:hypothetical protein
MNPVITRACYTVGLLVLFPLFVTVHGVIWVQQGVSFAPAVYGMKLALIPFLIVATAAVFPEILKDKMLRRAAWITVPCFAISLVMPWVHGDAINHYYVTDFAGLAVTVSALVVVFALLNRGILTLAWIERVFAAFLFIAASYTAIFFLINDGLKLNIPLEMHIPLALVLGAYLTPVEGGYRPPFIIVPIIALACLLSVLRENILIYTLVGAFCIVRSVFISSCRKAALLYIATTILLFVVVPDTRNLVIDRWHSIAIMKPGEANNSDYKYFSFIDASINQRLVEMELMYNEMRKEPMSFYTGKGFGATYKNINDVLIYYGERVHNAHSTPFLVYFRNGPPGLLLFMAIGIAAGITLFSRNTFVFRTSLCVLALYGALLFNQYLYWSVQYGLAVALWLYSLQHRRQP